MKISNYFGFVAIALLAACSKKDSKVSVDYQVDQNRSAVEWKGSAPTHFHRGAFKAAGQLTMDGKGKITGGDFSIPIASISNFDLTDPVEREKLLTHLKTVEFFNLALYPKATFHITKVGEAFDASSGQGKKVVPVTGDFTMIGQKHSIGFQAFVSTVKDSVVAEGSFKLNRLAWGMNSYSDPEGALYILPDVDITMKLYLYK